MLRKTVLALTAIVAAASITVGGSVAGAKTASKNATSATDPILLGNQNVETTTDSNGLQPRAWQYTASTTGSVTDIEAYDAKGHAKLTVGLYSDSSGRPGKLLATGSIRNTAASAWNDVRVGSASITAGTQYWLVWQGLDSFRDNRNGDCTTVEGNSPIRKVGSSWSTAWTVSGFCPASLYANGTTSVAPPLQALPAPVAPSNTTAPSITGTPQQGDTLTASPGSWSGDTPISSTYRWSDGTSGNTDTLGAADVGQTVSVTVTASNDGGSATATSEAVGPVTAPTPPPPAPPAPVAPSNTTAPSITGTPQQGDTLTASPGSWSGDTPISSTYRWSDGTSGNTDTLGAADVGQTVSVTVTASNDGGSATATSAAVGPVTAPPPALIPPTDTTAPAISGTPQVGDTLTVTNGAWAGDTPITFSVKWSDGATGARDTLTSADAGQTITATVTASNDAGSASASSAAVGPVTSTSETQTDGQGGINCAPDPSACGFPDATNTGPQPGHTLVQVPATGTSGGPGWTSSNGHVTVCGVACSAPGSSSATAQNFEVPTNADVTIPAPGNVTVQDFKVDGQSGRTTPDDFEGVSVQFGAHNVTIAHCDISGDEKNSPDSGPSTVYGGTVNRGDAGVVILPQISGSTYTAGGWGVTVEDCNIHGFHGPFWNKAEDGAGATSPAAAQVHIVGNYVHGTECWDYVDNMSCPAWGYPNGSSANTDHCNVYGQSNMPGLQASGDQNVLIDDNTLVNDYQPCESDIVAADSDNATSANLHWVVDHNLIAFEDPKIAEGSDCVQPGRTGGSGQSAGLPSYVAVTNNDIANCTPWLYDGPSLTGSGTGQNANNVECGNYFDDGPKQGFTADSNSFWDIGPSSPPTVCQAPSWLSSVPGWEVTDTPTP